MRRKPFRVLYVGKFDITSIDAGCRQGLSPSQHIHAVPELRKYGYELTFSDSNSCRMANKRDFQAQVLRAAAAADVVLAHSLGEVKALALLRRARLLRKPLVAFVHSLNASITGCQAARGADGLLALTNIAVKTIANCGVAPERVSYFPFGADAFFYRTAPAPGEHVLSVGVSGRDYDTLLASAASVDAPFALVGNLTQSQRASAPNNVKMPSNASYDLPFEQVLDLYNRALFVVITHHGTPHPFGINALVEAMAMAKAVILTDGPGIDIDPVQLGFGVKVPAHDPVALAAAIRHFLSEREMVHEMGLRARRLIETEYNTAHMGECLDAALRHVLR